MRLSAARLTLAAAVLVGLLLAHLATRTPAPVPADAPAAAFSAVRAMDDVRAIARAPHPSGSPENRRVRDYLLARLRSLGLEARLAPGVARTNPRRTAPARVAVENVLGVLPGRDRDAPALLLMSHYDSVPRSPGAADDAAGVAASLEVVRALQASDPPARDVVLLFTDGEELGLLGAQAFFTGGGGAAPDPLVARIGAVLNLETRGGGGRTVMFETSPDSGALVRLFGHAAPRPSSNSLAASVYERMPNGTDFTLAKAAGLPGMNFAFIGRPGQYHSPSSTPEALEQGALQHMGDQVLAVSRALTGSTRLPPRAPDAVYSDVLGAGFLAYPAWAGWLVLAVSIALTALAWRTPPPWREALLGVGGALLLLLSAGGALFFVALGLARIEYYDSLSAFGAIEAGVTAVCLLAALLVFAVLGRGRRSVSGVWFGFVAIGLLLTVVLQLLEPRVALLTGWPTLLACVAAAFAARDPQRPLSLAVTGALGALALGQIGAWAHFFALGLGVQRPEPFAFLTLLAAIPLAPLLLGSFTQRPAGVGTAPGRAVAAADDSGIARPAL